MKNPFFKNYGPLKIEDLLNNLSLQNLENYKNDLELEKHSAFQHLTCQERPEAEYLAN